MSFDRRSLAAPLVTADYGTGPDTSLPALEHDQCMARVQTCIQRVHVLSTDTTKALKQMQVSGRDAARLTAASRQVDEGKGVLEEGKALLARAAQAGGTGAIAAHRKLQRQKLFQSMQAAANALQRAAEMRVAVSAMADEASPTALERGEEPNSHRGDDRFKRAGGSYSSANVNDSLQSSGGRNWARSADPEPVREDPMLEMQLRDCVVQEREESIKAMQRDVHDIQQIFTDLAFHVQEQGVQMENIESNMASCAQNQAAAVDQLEVAVDRQKRCSCRTLALFMVLATALVLFLSATLSH